MTEKDPYEVLQIADSNLWPDGFDPYEAALDKFGSEDLGGLSRLLQSDDEIISSRGLHMFGELGTKAFPVIDDALNLVQHSYVRARRALIDGILCYSQRLSVPQVRQVLRLKDFIQQPEQGSEVVRGNVIVVLGNLEPMTLLQAIEGVPDKDLRTPHLQAFHNANGDPRNAQQRFDEARKQSGLEEAYSLASLIRATRDRKIDAPPCYEGNDFVALNIVAAIQRIINRNRRSDDPDAWMRHLVEQRKNRSAS